MSDEPRQRVDWKDVRRRLALAGEALTALADGVDTDVFARRGRRYAEAATDTNTHAATKLQLLVFRRGATRYAVPIGDLAEIRPATSITSIPGLAPAIRGVINASGRVVGVHDLAAISDTTQPGPLGPEARLLIGDGEASTMALLADEVDVVRPARLDDLSPPLLTMSLPPECFTGITEDGVLVLNLSGLMSSPLFFTA